MVLEQILCVSSPWPVSIWPPGNKNPRVHHVGDFFDAKRGKKRNGSGAGSGKKGFPGALNHSLIPGAD